jgi:putative transposase
MDVVRANQHSPNTDIITPNTRDTRAKYFSPLRSRRALPRSPSKTIGLVVRGFKIGVTKWFRQNSDVHTVWQRNYYDIIIRDEKVFQNISNYIINNPAKRTAHKSDAPKNRPYRLSS